MGKNELETNFRRQDETMGIDKCPRCGHDLYVANFVDSENDFGYIEYYCPRCKYHFQEE